MVARGVQCAVSPVTRATCVYLSLCCFTLHLSAGVARDARLQLRQLPFVVPDCPDLSPVYIGIFRPTGHDNAGLVNRL